MSGRFNWTHDTFWDDLKVRDWSTDATRIALYILTAPDRTSEGFFRLRMVNVCDHLKMDRATAEAAMAEVIAEDFAQYDPRAEVVFVCKALKYQPPKGPKSIPGAVNALDQIKGSPRLFWAFLGAAEHYAPEFAAAIRTRYGIDPDWRSGNPVDDAGEPIGRGIDGASMGHPISNRDDPPLALALAPTPTRPESASNPEPTGPSGPLGPDGPHAISRRVALAPDNPPTHQEP